MSEQSKTPFDKQLANARLLSLGTEPLATVRTQVDSLKGVLSDLEGAVDERAQRRVRHVDTMLSDFSATVTIVGQVKAGKTALINSIAGQPGLLSSDVNPWTSVVTTVHLNKPAPPNTRAEFQFFDKDEWDRIISGGGRLGEMASRAGAEDEVSEIARQVMEVRDKSKARLGRNFELLLGQRHNYDWFDSELVERYVCMGDPDDEDIQSGKQGRFADLTRSADLYLKVPQYPASLSIQDTPGVNDPFLMREQITLRCVRTAELCVVVLSASQALNTVDLALVRLLTNLEKRQVVIFVNRIDELQKPSVQVGEIRESLIETMKRHGVGGTADIVFGSAMWAEAALRGRVSQLPEESQEALFDWASVADVPGSDDATRMVWQLSGVPTLISAVGERVAQGSAQRVIQKARKQLKNIVAQSMATNIADQVQIDGQASVKMRSKEIAARAKEVSTKLHTELDKNIDTILAELHSRMETANESFIETTITNMIKHVEIHGAEGQWECDPMRLRMQLRAAYLNFTRSSRALSTNILKRASKDVIGLYRDLLGDPADGLRLEPPLAPAVPPPVAIGKTIVVDLQSSWWKKWTSTRRGSEAFAKEYRELIKGETDGIIREIEEQQAHSVTEALRLSLSEFLEDHADALVRIAKVGSVDADGLRTAIGAGEHSARTAALDSAMAALEELPAQAMRTAAQ